MTRLGRYAVPFLLFLAAVVCGAVALSRAPKHGLIRSRFSDLAFKAPAGPPELDSRIYFESDDTAHPVPSWLKNNSSVRWEGYVDAPREGEYIFQLISDDGGWLDLDGVRRIALPGAHGNEDKQYTIYLKPGLHRLKIEYTQVDATATMKLKWRLPSGYNRLGLLPVSMLHPTDTPGPTQTDRVLRWMTSLLLLAALAWLLREHLAALLAHLRSDPSARRRAWAGLFVFALVLGVRLYDLNGEGETSDEWAYQGAGHIYAENIAAGVFDADQWEINREHPAVGKLVYGYVYYNFGASPTAGRVAAALMNSVTALLTFLVALRLFGMESALMAGIILALLPPFVAHGKISALDCPATFFHAWAMWLFLRGLHDSKRRPSSFAWLAVVTGLAVATKLTNALLVIFFIGVTPLVQWRRLRETGELRVPVGLYVLPIAAVIPFVLLWPWLWGNSLSHLTETLNHWTSLPGELFFGREERPPLYFFVVCFAAVTPVLLAPFFLTGIAQAFRKSPPPVLRAKDDDGLISDRAWWWLLIGWFLLPFLWTFSLHLQDGIRYVYAAYLPFAILTGAGATIAVTKARAWLSSTRWAPFLFPASALALAGYLTATCASVHPFYLDYFNELTGGAGNVYRTRFMETSWWGEGINRAGDWLDSHAEKGATYRLHGGINHTLIGLRDDLQLVSDGGDYIVHTYFSPGNEGLPGYSEVYMLRVQGAPIVGVFKKNGDKPWRVVAPTPVTTNR